MNLRNVIIGTDWWDDCDDAVALRVLTRAHKDKQIQIKGIAINACMEQSVTSLHGFLRAEKVEDIPIGIDRQATDFAGRLTYQSRLADLCEKGISNETAEEAIKLYRRILEACNEPVEIIEIGFLQVVSALLDSQPDEISPLTGMELVARKVKKFWVMAGRWDVNEGRENNFARNQRARTGAHNFCKNCPVPITFLGWEVGNDVITGSHLADNDILKCVLCDHGSVSGRKSWDPMLAILAVIGDEKRAGYKTVQGVASVDATTGINTFLENEKGNHTFVVKMHTNEFYADMIDSCIESI